MGRNNVTILYAFTHSSHEQKITQGDFLGSLAVFISDFSFSEIGGHIMIKDPSLSYCSLVSRGRVVGCIPLQGYKVPVV